MSNYYIRNIETGKLELHFEKEDYMALTDEQKDTIKSNFLFSRKTGAWISRCKFPNLYRPEKVAQDLGLENRGVEGETLSFAEQMERKEERAEQRAERYETKAEKAVERGNALCAPLESMHGDNSFFTQPNISTASGRAFTRKREKMFAAWDRGYEEFKKSEYYSECAERARDTADGKNAKDKGFCQRRIDEAESNIRKLNENLKEYRGYKETIEAGGIPHDKYGYEIKLSTESLDMNIDRWEEMLEAEISKSVYYHEAIEAAGGIQFSKENLHKGDLIQINKYHHCIVRIVRFGKKNVTFEFLEKHMRLADGTPMQGKCAYAEIEKVVEAV